MSTRSTVRSQVPGAGGPPAAMASLPAGAKDRPRRSKVRSNDRIWPAPTVAGGFERNVPTAATDWGAVSVNWIAGPPSAWRSISTSLDRSRAVRCTAVTIARSGVVETTTSVADRLSPAATGEGLADGAADGPAVELGR